MPQGVTSTLATFISGISAERIPDRTRALVANAFVDAIGCTVFGLLTPWARIVHGFALDQGGPPESSIAAGDGRKVSAMNAALAAGTALHSFEVDDHNGGGKIHPGAAVIPAAFALGEREGIGGEKLLSAIAAGYETMIRVSLANGPVSSRMRGWHLTGTCGTFGAAAAASVILGLDAQTTASALGLAGTQSSGLFAFSADGAMSKRLHAGRAAQSGIMAALLAARGFHGPRFILEAPDGGFLAATSDDVRIAEITAGLGDEWRTDGVIFKPHACCGSNHAAIDAALAIMAEQRLHPHDIDHVVAGVSRSVETQCGFVYQPSTVLNAQMSQRYNIAVAMLDGQAYVEQFTEQRIRDADACDLAARVRVEVDPDMEAVYPRLYAGKVSVVTKSGQRITKRVDHPKGAPENPMSADEIARKFLSLAEAAIGRAAAESLLAEVHRGVDAATITPLAAMLGRCRVTGRL